VIARFGYIEPLNQTDMETWRLGDLEEMGRKMGRKMD
jgi:hypothetical protein